MSQELEHVFEQKRVDRFYQMQIEPGRSRLLACVGISTSGLRYDFHVCKLRVGAQARAHFKPVHTRHGDIKEDDVRPEFCRGTQGARPIQAGSDFVAERFDGP